MAAQRLRRVAKIDLMREGGAAEVLSTLPAQGPDGPGMWPSCAVGRVLVRAGQIARGSARTVTQADVATPARVCSKIRTVCYGV